MNGWRSRVAFLGVILAAVGIWSAVFMFEAKPPAPVEREPGREYWRVTVGGGKPPRIQLVSPDRSDPEPRLRAMVADLVVEVCSKVHEPPVCVDEIVAEGLARLGKP